MSGFELRAGIHVAAGAHREDDFPEAGFATLLRMQRDHFWYRGRHRVVLDAARRARAGGLAGARALDLGGGCGGWLEYLHAREPGLAELALADSSLRALELAGPVVGAFAERYRVDLLDLPWRDAWDVAFLLDVIEHLDDDAAALRQAHRALAPGGVLLVTTPALQRFWSYNDDFAHHKRRYCRADYRQLAARTGFRLLRADYFMFALSPALLLSRALRGPRSGASEAEVEAAVEREHRVPPRPLNAALAGVLAAEARLVRRVPLPWGTSILAVLQKP